MWPSYSISIRHSGFRQFNGLSRSSIRLRISKQVHYLDQHCLSLSSRRREAESCKTRMVLSVSQLIFLESCRVVEWEVPVETFFAPTASTIWTSAFSRTHGSARISGFSSVQNSTTLPTHATSAFRKDAPTPPTF